MTPQIRDVSHDHRSLVRNFLGLAASMKPQVLSLLSFLSLATSVQSYAAWLKCFADLKDEEEIVMCVHRSPLSIIVVSSIIDIAVHCGFFAVL
jgi:hypothetical protein